MLKTCIAVCIIGLFLTSCQTTNRKNFAGETYTENIPGERIEFTSFTPLSGRQIYLKEGETTKVVGYLQIPDGASGKVPVVIIQHCGSGVKQDKEIRFATILNKAGYATFIVDSFGIRQIKDEGGESLKYTYIPMADAYAALTAMSKDARIDRDRIAIMGWANAGTGILNNQIGHIYQTLADSGLRFAAAVSIQPFCNLAWVSDQNTGTPTLVQTGKLDAGFPSSACTEYASRLNATGARMSHISYSGAGHNWQSSNPARINDRRRITEGCRMQFNADKLQRSRHRYEEGS